MLKGQLHGEHSAKLVKKYKKLTHFNHTNSRN